MSANDSPQSEKIRVEDYGQHYSEEDFWTKLTRYALAAGRKVVEKALTLYYTAGGKDTPLWAKTLIIGALGYFILPLDAIPDILPVVGYSDDLGVLIAALTAVNANIQPEFRQKAQETLQKWFGGEVQIPTVENKTL